jgi:hypothetical protein
MMVLLEHINKETELDYYRILKSSLDSSSSAKMLILTRLAGMDSNESKYPIGMASKISNNSVVTHHSIVNPSGYLRSEVFNITLEIYKNPNYIVCAKMYQSYTYTCDLDAYYVDLLEIGEETKSIQISK